LEKSIEHIHCLRRAKGGGKCWRRLKVHENSVCNNLLRWHILDPILIVFYKKFHTNHSYNNKQSSKQ
jgi:hypothetical protein